MSVELSSQLNRHFGAFSILLQTKKVQLAMFFHKKFYAPLYIHVQVMYSHVATKISLLAHFY